MASGFEEAARVAAHFLARQTGTRRMGLVEDMQQAALLDLLETLKTEEGHSAEEMRRVALKAARRVANEALRKPRSLDAMRDDTGFQPIAQDAAQEPGRSYRAAGRYNTLSTGMIAHLPKRHKPVIAGPYKFGGLRWHRIDNRVVIAVPGGDPVFCTWNGLLRLIKNLSGKSKP